MLEGSYNFVLFGGGEVDGGDDLDVFLLIEDLAVRDVDLDHLLQLGKPIYHSTYLPASTTVSMKFIVILW